MPNFCLQFGSDMAKNPNVSIAFRANTFHELHINSHWIKLPATGLFQSLLQLIEMLFEGNPPMSRRFPQNDQSRGGQSDGMAWRYLETIYSLCNPRDHCTHSLFQDCCTVERISSNRLTYFHMGTTLWRGIILYALIRETKHGIIVGKRVRARRLGDRYYTRVWVSGMFWCGH